MNVATILYGLIKVLRVLAAAAIIAGIVGRGLLRARLVHVEDLRVAGELIAVEGQFDRWLVIQGSNLTLVTGVLLTVLGHWPLLHNGLPTWTLVGAVLFLTTVPLVLWVYVPRGNAFGAAFQEALAKQHLTAEMRLALSDRVIERSYRYEYVMFPLVTALMVMKPF